MERTQATITEAKRLLRRLREGSITDEEFGQIMPLAFEVQKQTEALGIFQRKATVDDRCGGAGCGALNM